MLSKSGLVKFCTSPPPPIMCRVPTINTNWPVHVRVLTSTKDLFHLVSSVRHIIQLSNESYGVRSNYSTFQCALHSSTHFSYSAISIFLEWSSTDTSSLFEAHPVSFFYYFFSSLWPSFLIFARFLHQMNHGCKNPDERVQGSLSREMGPRWGSCVSSHPLIILPGLIKIAAKWRQCFRLEYRPDRH